MKELEKGGIKQGLRGWKVLEKSHFGASVSEQKKHLSVISADVLGGGGGGGGVFEKTTILSRFPKQHSPPAPSTIYNRAKRWNPVGK